MSGRIRRNRWVQLLSLAVAVLYVLLTWQWESEQLPQTGWQRPQGQLNNGTYEVLRIVDGDTIMLKQDRLRVRLQGIDTPETVKENTAVEPWGPEASKFTQQFLENAHWQVQVEIDGEPVDRYGRHLAFIWHDGRMLNEELVRQGLAHAKTTFDYSQAKKQRLRQAQQQAQAKKLGIWSTP